RGERPGLPEDKERRAFRVCSRHLIDERQRLTESTARPVNDEGGIAALPGARVCQLGPAEERLRLFWLPGKEVEDHPTPERGPRAGKEPLHLEESPLGCVAIARDPLCPDEMVVRVELVVLLHLPGRGRNDAIDIPAQVPDRDQMMVSLCVQGISRQHLAQISG